MLAIRHTRAVDASRVFPFVALFASLVAGACFYGRFAIDDSYIGYSNAQNLLTRGCFCFNPGEHLLTTSAPLVVPLYAAFAWLTHADIVAIAQVFSLAALLVLSYCTYALGARLVSPLAGLYASIALTLSPLVLMEWSHESLIWLALSSASLLAFASKRRSASALLLGIAALTRPESFLALPFFAFAMIRKREWKALLRYSAIAIVPYGMWAFYALHAFGTFTTESLEAKRAQLLYGGSEYATGLALSFPRIYEHVVHIPVLRHITYVVPFVLLAGVIFARQWRALHWYVLGWSLVTFALYVGARVRFFYWFGFQIPVMLAALAAAAWIDDVRVTPRRAALARIAATVLVSLNVLALIPLFKAPARVLSQADSLVVMPRIGNNSYFRLALWLRSHTNPEDTVAYPEIGQLRYYSQRRIIDYIGLATPGVAKHMLAGDTIWAFERYRPTIFVFAPFNWRYIVDPTEYDWFSRAYVKIASLNYGPGFSDRFVIYRLRKPALIPAPATRAATAVDVVRREGPAVVALPRLTNVRRIELRVEGICARGRLEEVFNTRAITQPVRFVGVRRYTLAIPPRAQLAEVSLRGCPQAELDPPLKPRRGFELLDTGIALGEVRDAVVAYRR